MNKLAILLVIAYYMDWNWAFWDVQLAFDEIDHPILYPGREPIEDHRSPANIPMQG